MTTQSLQKKMTALLVLLSFVTLQSLAAVPVQPNNGGLTAKAHYLGIQDGQLLFTVNFTKEDESNNKQIGISVLANGEYEIFENQYKVSKGQVLFKIDLTEIKDIDFTIRSNGQKINYHFEINTSYKEEVKVKEVK